MTEEQANLLNTMRSSILTAKNTSFRDWRRRNEVDEDKALISYIDLLRGIVELPYSSLQVVRELELSGYVRFIASIDKECVIARLKEAALD